MLTFCDSSPLFGESIRKPIGESSHSSETEAYCNALFENFVAFKDALHVWSIPLKDAFHVLI